ncbi:MAG: beta-phosphoglucomutase family hydrolase [Aeromonadales bacterium]|nr:beta-phosphoglucomutase family hydrolase [Aeromonadales bacterium]
MNLEEIKKYKGLIFDLDGTLTDSMPFHAKAWRQVANEHGFDIDESQIYAMGGASSYDIANFYKDKGNPVGDVNSFVKRKIEIYTANIDKVELFNHIATILKNAKSRGQKIAIGTGTRISNATYILKAKGLDTYIDALVTADDVKEHKPDPATFLEAAKRLNLAPQECVIFEDGQLGIEAARNGSFDCIEVNNDRIVHYHQIKRD